MLLGKLFLFSLTSSAVYIGMFALMFSLFKVHYRWYIPQIIFSCAFLSYISFTMRTSGLESYAAGVQLAVWIVMMWLFFRFPLLYAAVMTTVGFFIGGVVDTAVALTLLLNGIEIGQFSVEMYGAALVSGSLSLLLARTISRKGIGFSFVREDARVNKDDHAHSTFLLMNVVVFSIVGFFVVYLCCMVFYTTITFVMAAVYLILSCCVIIYLSYLRERRGYQNNYH